MASASKGHVDTMRRVGDDPKARQKLAGHLGGEASFRCTSDLAYVLSNEAAFANLLSLVDEAGLAFVHAFPYSPRPGTPAARMPQLPRPTIKARAAAKHTEAA